MSNVTILTNTQRLFLELFGKQSFSQKFYLSGGTALAGFYIPYRYSEDLDFFSEIEVQTDEIIAYFRSIKDKIGFEDLVPSLDHLLIHFSKFMETYRDQEFEERF